MKRTIPELVAALRHSKSQKVQLTLNESEERRADGSMRNNLELFTLDREKLLAALGGAREDGDDHR